MPRDVKGWGVAVFYAASKTKAFWGYGQKNSVWVGTFRDAQEYCRELKKEYMRGRPVRVRITAKQQR